jgi:hypothetical protein
MHANIHKQSFVENGSYCLRKGFSSYSSVNFQKDSEKTFITGNRITFLGLQSLSFRDGYALKK